MKFKLYVYRNQWFIRHFSEIGYFERLTYKHNLNFMFFVFLGWAVDIKIMFSVMIT
jgi:hypothetical protein